MIISKMRKTAAIGALLLAMTAVFASCNEEPENGLTPSMRVYQEYEVYISEGIPAAFANIRETDAMGRRIEIQPGTLSCNTREMYFTGDLGKFEFDYASQLEANHKYATFRFQRSTHKTLTNTITFSDIPELPLPDLTQIENGVSYPLDCSTVPEEFDIKVSLSPSSTQLNTAPVYADLDREQGYFSFFAAPAGSYTLRVDVIRTEPTVENDTPATGIMRAIRRTATPYTVTVPVVIL